ncbi:hypothetical protein IWZ03DRAFT_373656, partial [Phyllosticta citriasiana]
FFFFFFFFVLSCSISTAFPVWRRLHWSACVHFKRYGTRQPSFRLFSLNYRLASRRTDGEVAKVDGAWTQS